MQACLSQYLYLDVLRRCFTSAKLIRSRFCWLYNVSSGLCWTTFLRTSCPVYPYLGWPKKVLVGGLKGGSEATTILCLTYIVVGLIPQVTGMRLQMGLQVLHLPLHRPAIFLTLRMKCLFQPHDEGPYLLQGSHPITVRDNEERHMFQFILLELYLVLVGSRLFLISLLSSHLPCGL